MPAWFWLPFLVTSMFLHGGWLHVFSNMWTLWIFGDNVEDRLGHGRYLGFYLLSGLAAAAIHTLTNTDSTLPTIGASGAIAGVMGAYFVLFPGARVVTLIPIFFWPLFVELPAILYLGFWFLTQFYSGTLSLAAGRDAGGIAWWAHVGGFLVGSGDRPGAPQPRPPLAVLRSRTRGPDLTSSAGSGSRARPGQGRLSAARTPAGIRRAS